MRIGDLVKLWVNAEYCVTGILVAKDTSTYPERVFVRTHKGDIVDGYDDECEVLSAA